MKRVHLMSSAELLEEARIRELNRAAGRPLSYRGPELLTPEQLEEVERKAHVDEKREQWAITRMARAIHFKVYNLSQARASKQTPGIGDLFMTLEAIGFAAWWETKRQVGGERSTAQEEFAAECLASRIPYGFGDRYHFAEFLRTHGFTPPVIPAD